MGGLDKVEKSLNTLPLKTAHSIMSGGKTVFCNPPYGRAIPEWVRKCSMEASRKDTLVVMLLPARTDTRWFQQYILNRAEVRFLKGRLRFETNGIPGGPAPFPSMIVVMRTGER
ncbi:MAG: DNA N-6-adenine-methyltransferase [Bifidobacterium sp.]|uniref:DNA N-6-adenine-methyltransferase n=1 Tax=Bifidobacterium sp. TaxID=41200 RepID=UPI00283EE9F9|nr:DNA N-6-adenine-methyltransferase [Bifidobacterium sp.]MDR3912966.1 DNA N-6-adenine-methyltransferase [Bifidobacterium sp.]